MEDNQTTETVPNLITTGEAQWTELTRVLSEEMGFVITYHVLDSLHFGLPQQRKRVYLAARRDGIAPLPFEDRVPPAPCRLADILEDL